MKLSYYLHKIVGEAFLFVNNLPKVSLDLYNIAIY